MSMTISRYLSKKTMVAVLVGFAVSAGSLFTTDTADAKSYRHHRVHHAVTHHVAKQRIVKQHIRRHHRYHNEVAVAIGGAVTSIGSTGNSIVSIARSQIGNGAVYGRSRLWCARFMNWVVVKAGYKGTGSDMAESFAHVGTRVNGPQIGAIAVMGRRGGGHVGVVSGIDSGGNPIIISGNHAGRVRESVYPRGHIHEYVAL